MKCHVCGADNPDDAFFCGNCGAQLQSLLSSPSGPVEKVDGDIEVEPLIVGPRESPAESTPSRPEPAGPPRVDVNRPSAGLAPPARPAAPPRSADSGASGPPPPPPAYPGAPPAAYQPPAAAPAYGQPGGYPPGYPHYQPPDGNTSGMGPGYPAPAEASGWTFAGCVPFGLFAFFNGSIIWGLVAVLGGFIPYIGGIAGLVYLIYIGVQGRELAWRSRRFANLRQYVETMNAWNTWGLVLGLISLIGGVLMFFLVFAVMMSEMPY
jgi:hypothetical protein